jgi:hypothetical protein
VTVDGLRVSPARPYDGEYDIHPMRQYRTMGDDTPD